MSQQRDRPGEDPSAHNEADIINFEQAGREHPRKTELPVELFLLSDEGRAEMDALNATIDNSGRIIRTVSIKIGEMMEKMVEDKDPDIYSLFLHDDGVVGLTRPELIDLYKTNPLINATMRAGGVKHHNGDFQAQEMYTYSLRIFMNMVRYEWLTRTYDSDDPKWEDRTRRLGNFYGSEMHVNLQPGINRAIVIPRNHTPSDYLRRPLT